MKHWLIIRKCYIVTTISYQWLEFFFKFAEHGDSNLCLQNLILNAQHNMKKLHRIPTRHQIGFSTSIRHKPNMVPSCCAVATHRFRVTTPFNVWSNDAFLSSLCHKLWPFSHFAPLKGLDPTLLVSFPHVKFRHCIDKKVQQSKFLLFFHLCGVPGFISVKVQWQRLFSFLPLWSSEFCRHKVHWQQFFSLIFM